MLGMVSCYDPQKHTILHGELGAFCEKLVEHLPQEKGKIFVVRYDKIGTFCICRWVGKPYDVFVDVMNLGTSLANFNRKKAYELRQRLFKPLTCDDTSRILSDNESVYHHARQDLNEEETERWARLKRGE